MIQSTKKLIEYLKNDKDNRESSIVHSYVNSILKLGEKNDASH